MSNSWISNLFSPEDTLTIIEFTMVYHPNPKERYPHAKRPFQLAAYCDMENDLIKFNLTFETEEAMQAVVNNWNERLKEKRVLTVGFVRDVLSGKINL